MGFEEDSCEAQEQIQVPIQTDLAVEVAPTLKDITVDFEALSVGRDPEKSLYSAVVQQAIEDYLFFDARGKNNGATPEDFLSAYRYLFITRSQQRDTDKAKCFDVQYDSSGFADVLKRDVMLTLIKSQREKLVANEYDSMARKMNSRRREFQEANPGTFKPVNYDKPYLSKVLVDPTEDSVARLYMGR